MADITPPKSQPGPFQIARMRDAQYKELYSNSNLISLTPFDMSITFQKASEFVPGTIAMVNLVAVSMSPQHFKGFVRAASETLEAYERSFGELNIPDQDIRPISNAAQIEAMIQKMRAANPANPSSNEPPQPYDAPPEKWK